jgi:AraC-like DNA-binding protein
MTRPRTTPPPPQKDKEAERIAAIVRDALVAAVSDKAFVRLLGAAIGGEYRRTQGSLQENAAHAGFSESYFSKLLKDGDGPPVNRVSNNCVRIKFADTDRAIENLSSADKAGTV